MTNEELGNLIDAHSMLNTTSETLAFLRRRNTDAFILDSLEFCSVCNRQALQQLLNKKPIEYLDGPELEYKDVIESMSE